MEPGEGWPGVHSARLGLKVGVSGAQANGPGLACGGASVSAPQSRGRVADRGSCTLLPFQACVGEDCCVPVSVRPGSSSPWLIKGTDVRTQICDVRLDFKSPLLPTSVRSLGTDFI